jgi:serine phosphatase RsbU (regulator of sigma subunit)
MTKLGHNTRLQQIRADRLAPASELLWQLLPPRTLATEQVVISALLEPVDRVAGDAYDYAVGDAIDLAVFDGVGHDLMAGVSTALALTAIRNARRAGITDLAAQAAKADSMLTEHDREGRFVTAALARLDTATGELAYLLAGHPAPLLLRDGRMVKELAAPPRLPLGVSIPDAAAAVVGREQLEPGDRVLLYTDGVTEARDTHGRFFGEQRLIDMAERAELDQLSAPETLRRLVAAVMTHQAGRLQDDATLLLLDWASDRHPRLFPSLLDPAPGG